MRTAWIFPGHGSQYIGMGQTLLRKTEQGRRWLALAENVSDLPLGIVMERGPVSELVRPTILEPLLAAISCAYVDWLTASNIKPTVVAGYSAGEVAAMYAAGVFDAETCMRIACLRGCALAQTAAVQQGSMMSLYGLPVADLIALVESMGGGESVGVAAYNGPRHLTISGTATGLAQVAARSHSLGAQTSVLNVAGPWHTHLAESAQQQLSIDLAVLPFSTPHIPIWLGSDGAACSDTALLRRSLANSIVLPVHWHPLVDDLLAADVEAFLEVGPGHTLCGLLGQMSLPPKIKYSFLERPGMVRLRIFENTHYQELRKE